MKRITIERNKNAADLGCAGQIEGETDDGRRWILFMDEHGAPKVFWPKRDDDGGVVGDGINLADPPWDFKGVFDLLNVDTEAGEEVLTTYPTFEDGTRGVVFAITPPSAIRTDIDPREAQPTFRMINFLHRIATEWSVEWALDGWQDLSQGVDPGLGDGADHPGPAGALADPGDTDTPDEDLGDQPGVPQV